MPTAGHKRNHEAGDASGEVSDGHQGASTDSVDHQIEDEPSGKLHYSRDKEIQEEVVACDSQPQDQALKHNSACKPGSEEYRVKFIPHFPLQEQSIGYFSIIWYKVTK